MYSTVSTRMLGIYKYINQIKKIFSKAASFRFICLLFITNKLVLFTFNAQKKQLKSNLIIVKLNYKLRKMYNIS